MVQSMPRGRDARSRDRVWPFAIWGALAVIVLVVVAAVMSLPRPSVPAPVRSADWINIHGSELGSDWRLHSLGNLSGLKGLVDYDYRSYERPSAYGGTVQVGSSVELFNSPENATRRFAELNVIMSKLATGAAVDAGEQGVLYDSDRGFEVLFVRGDAVVVLGAYGMGVWEDLSGRAFSAEYRMAGDLLVLARLVDSRI